MERHLREEKEQLTIVKDRERQEIVGSPQVKIADLEEKLKASETAIKRCGYIMIIY